jgi:hypothetical protein
MRPRKRIRAGLTTVHEDGFVYPCELPDEDDWREDDRSQNKELPSKSFTRRSHDQERKQEDWDGEE